MPLTAAQKRNIEDLKAGRGFRENARWEQNPEYNAAVIEAFNELEAIADISKAQQAVVTAAIAQQKANKRASTPSTQPRLEMDKGKSQFCTNTLSGSMHALIHAIRPLATIDPNELAAAIKKLAEGTDTNEIQVMLATQAITLQAVFNSQLMGMGNCSTQGGVNAFADRAMRAQEQCRKTLQTLAEVKNPRRPSQFIKTYVSKQLNQLRLEQKNSETFQPNPANELLKESLNAAVDSGGTAAAAKTHPVLETVGEINRPENT
jgi:hypothetical protein